jgi:hypothetical protein
MEHIKIYDEFLGELNESTTGKEGGGDFDHFGRIVKPLMDAAGFKWVPEKVSYGQPLGYADGYYCFPNHNTGVNLFLQKSFSSPWKYVVYFSAKGDDSKEFGWPKGTDAEVRAAAEAAANYAIALKEKNFK